MKYELNTKYSNLQPLIDDIEAYFQQSKQVLHAERNEIRVVEFEGEDYVIKSFKVPNVVNRFVYRYLRASKAKRSYLYSLRLGKKLCPEAIAYIEKYKSGLLDHSYYISRHFDYDFTIRPVFLEKDFANRVEVLEKFSEFTYQLHQKDILHRDYSPGNILIKQENSQYQFKIVDVNRMQFKILSLQDRLMNFARLMMDDETLAILIKPYAILMHESEDKLFTMTRDYRNKLTYQRELKNKLRGRK